MSENYQEKDLEKGGQENFCNVDDWKGRAADDDSKNHTVFWFEDAA